MPDVRHDTDQNRFAADVEGGTAELRYQRRDGALVFVHTFVPEPSRGQDVGEALVEAGLAYARENKLGVVAQCPYVAHYVETHPEAQDLVA
ncbi:GNAT family N-acetyltransferase [Rubrivirga sp.]|uniref:GNAT family N-acetyltransferase n=1 Tax=Rubrivirga sp. TaxID=1885344 RepID=UPI003B52ABF4